MQDIDAPDLESKLIQQLDPQLISSIHSFYYELHFDVKEMRPYFGDQNPMTYTQTIEELYSLRAKGLALHPWP